jgi:hypothetical protein
MQLCGDESHLIVPWPDAGDHAPGGAISELVRLAMPVGKRIFIERRAWGDIDCAPLRDGLTPAKAQIALALAAGHSPEALAAWMNRRGLLTLSLTAADAYLGLDRLYARPPSVRALDARQPVTYFIEGGHCQSARRRDPGRMGLPGLGGRSRRRAAL